MSLCRQNYHVDCEAGVNKQINLELQAMYAYMAMTAYYDRDDVALGKVASFFRKSAAEEKCHADLLIEYQNKRGGCVTLEPIPTPSQDTFENLEQAFQAALDLEKKVNQALLGLHEVAAKHDDAQMTDFLEGSFLGEQVDAIKVLASHVTNLKRLGAGQGEWHFNNTLEI